ncbi:MAG: hypothetical protein IIY94_08975 [Oscillospiraceae bacterium]|nr:hypothetical protein [Oscillospiraceae bacterium]
MLKKMKARLESQSGESIAEVLVAVMLSAIGLTMLALMISATTRMVIRSKNITSDYVGSNNQLVEKGDTTLNGEVEVLFVDPISGVQHKRLTDESSEDYKIPVRYYINDNIGNVSVTSYKKGSES